MSRSVRKRPYSGYTTCTSEEKYKRFWRRRWRLRECLALACKGVEALENHLTSLKNEIVNTYRMGKDCHLYTPLSWRFWNVSRKNSNLAAMLSLKKMILRNGYLHPVKRLTILWSVPWTGRQAPG